MDSSFWNKLKKTIMTAPKDEPTSAQQVNRFNKCWTVVQVSTLGGQASNDTVGEAQTEPMAKRISGVIQLDETDG